MRTHCRCFGGPEQARLITVTCLYFDVCFILRRLGSRAIDFASLSKRLKAVSLDNATSPLLFTGFYSIEVVAALTRPGLLNWVYDCLEDTHSNTSHHSTDWILKEKCCRNRSLFRSFRWQRATPF